MWYFITKIYRRHKSGAGEEGQGTAELHHHEQENKTQKRSRPFALSQVPFHEMLLFR